MKWATLGLQRVLVCLGFVMVGVGNLPLLTLASPSSNDEFFYLIVSAIGYAVLAWASWAWLTALSKRQDGASGMRRVLRLFALACLLLGIAYLGLIDEVVHSYLQPSHFGLRAVAISDFLSILGFCLAALGFWTVANVVESGPSPSQNETVESAEVEPTVR